MASPMEIDDPDSAGSSFISSDSSFYGDDSLRTHLEDLSSSFDPSSYWATCRLTLPSIAAKAALSSPPTKPLYNPYAGLLHARQLSESIPDFLARLPPLTTPISTGPLIFIANPYSAHRPNSEDWASFMTVGQHVLSELTKNKIRIESSMVGRPKSCTAKAITPLRKSAEKAILTAAKEKGCTTGKWMLFPSPEIVNRTWRLVADATASGELGIAAKVATDDGGGEGKARLIGVYTGDFSDREDVARVVRRMREMGLFGEGGRGVYYKCDAYTNLGIDSRNEWGIKASLFSSAEVLKEGGR